MSDSIEVWQSVVPGTVVIGHNGVDGRRDEQIRPGREFSVSSADRRAYQIRVSGAVYDPFTNGSFVPVQLPDGVEGELGIQSNHISDDDVLLIATGAKIEAVEALKELTAPAVVSRVLVAAKNVGADPARLELIRTHMNDLDPQVR